MNKPYLRLVARQDEPAEKPKAKPARPKSRKPGPFIQFEKVGQQRLRVAIWKGQGKGRPLLYFNGIGVNLELAGPLAAALPDRDVVTFDMPGIGLSPPPRLPYRPWWAAHAAAKILDRNGYTDKIDVMGVSWGGAVAQQFAFQCAHRVNRVALAATSIGVPTLPAGLNPLLAMFAPLRSSEPEQLRKDIGGLYGPSAFDGVARLLLAPSPWGYWGQVAALAGWSALPLLPFLQKPALVLSGDRDHLVPLVNGRILSALLPNGRLHVVKGGGHLFVLSRLAEVAPLLRAFFDEDSIEHVRAQAMTTPKKKRTKTRKP
jgi:pimeloyl-ACP methyl ester carboxylesterase